MYDPLIVDKFIETHAKLSQLAEVDEAEKEAIDTLATKLRIVPEASSLTLVESSDHLPLKALAILKSIKPSPNGISIDDLGGVVSKQLSKLTGFSAIALYCITENERAIKCRYADKLLAELVDSPEIPLGERLSGWVAAHRTPIWNSDATLDLSGDVAKQADVALGSSVPLLDGDLLVGTLTLYCNAGNEIAVEQRLLIQSIAPLLATALSSSIAHDEVSAIDASNKSDREALYSVIDTLISGRSQWLDRNDPNRLTIVWVSWRGNNLEAEKQRAMQAIIQRAIASATNNTGHLLRLSAVDMLITAPFSVLTAAGLTPNAHKSVKSSDVLVTEIANSLQLREVLGLTNSGDSKFHHERRLIH
jgi:GAF domain-containing protein